MAEIGLTVNSRPVKKPLVSVRGRARNCFESHAARGTPITGSVLALSVPLTLLMFPQNSVKLRL